MARPPVGPRIVFEHPHFTGSDAAKERVYWGLETLCGTRIAEACGALRVREARFHELRLQWLQAAIDGAESQPAGRKPKAASITGLEARIEELEARNRELEIQLSVTGVRAALAITMPHVLDQPQLLVKKGGPHRATS